MLSHIREELFIFFLVVLSLPPYRLSPIAIYANLCMRTDSEHDFLRILSGGIRPNDRADIGQSLCVACRVRKFYPKEKWSSRKQIQVFFFFWKLKVCSNCIRWEID